MNALLVTEYDELYDVLDLAEKNEGILNDGESIPGLKERFCITDLNGANWAFRKIKALKEKMDESKDLAIAEQARIANWLASQNNKDENTIAFFESLLIGYFQAEREIDAKFKLSTPYGKITARKNDKWEYNEDELVQSLKNADLTDYIKITESPMKAEIKRAKTIFFVTELGTLTTKDGDVIDGVTVLEGETISVKVE